MSGKQQNNDKHSAQQHWLQLVGSRLQQARIQQQYSIEQVAHAVHIPVSQLDALENGRFPEFEILLLFKLCHYYHVSAEDMLKMEE